MARGIPEVHTAATVVVIDLARMLCARVGPMDDAAVGDPG